MDKNPGCEGQMFKQLLKLSADESLSLPPIPSASGGHSGPSVLSINTIADKSEQLKESLWRDVCMRFRRHLVERLKKLPTIDARPAINVYRKKRVEWVQSLCCLFSPADIWPRYRTLRAQQCDSCLMCRSEQTSFIQAVDLFHKCVTTTVISMINDDLELFNSGVFQHATSVFHGLHDIYLERISDEISVILDNLQEELCDGSANAKDLPKSTSEMGKLGYLRGTLKRQKSKSLDSLLGKDDGFTDFQALPLAYVEALVTFVQAIMTLDSYIDSLHADMVWEVSGNPFRKTSSKRDLKGR